MNIHNIRAINKIVFNRSVRDSSKTYDYLIIPSVPHSEKCTQAGVNEQDGLIECRVMIEQVEKALGTSPAGVEFFILENYHDEAGIYHEPAVLFISQDESLEVPEETPQWEYANDCESYSGEKWDEVSLLRLRELEHTQYQPAKVIQMKQAS